MLKILFIRENNYGLVFGDTEGRIEDKDEEDSCFSNLRRHLHGSPVYRGRILQRTRLGERSLPC